MAINFTSLGGPANPTPTPTEVAPATGGVSLDLEKNTILDLAKAAPGLTKVDLCAGWDISAGGADFDLDISAFLLNEAGKITSASDVIFYNNKTAPGIHLNGDNRTGAGDGDDEVINLDLAALSPSIHKVICAVTIDQAITRRQTFGMVNNSYVRLVNSENNSELCKFQLKDDYSTDTAVVFAELVKDGSTWAFHTIGEGKQADLNGIAALFS